MRGLVVRTLARRACAAVAAMLLFGVTAGHAAEPVDMPDGGQPLVDHRVEDMKKMGGALGAIADVVKGEKPYSAKLTDAARTVEHVADHVPAMFKPGTARGDEGITETRAKPEIWQEWDTFVEKAENLQAVTGPLIAAVETGDRGKMGAALKNVGDACGGCHKPYRYPKEGE